MPQTSEFSWLYFSLIWTILMILFLMNYQKKSFLASKKFLLTKKIWFNQMMF